MIYLDNAATSFPKPPAVYEAADRYARAVGASGGRSAYGAAVDASRIIFSAREAIAGLFSVPDSSRIVFTLNATFALNLALFGLIKPGERVCVSSLEHNSVMRPLRRIVEERGAIVTVVPCGEDGSLDERAWESALTIGCDWAVINHGSNIIGTVVPLEFFGNLCRKHGARLIVDAAQTAGLIDIDVGAMNIDLLAFSGHKGLYGPQGTGGLYIGEGLDPIPLVFGGTGSNSESDEQPVMLPDRFESGTLNGPGIAGLHAGVSFVKSVGTGVIHAHEMRLTAMLREGLRLLPRVRIHGPRHPYLPILSMTIDGCDNGQAGRRLNEEYGVAVRIGLHCAPMAHRVMGTFPEGTIRFSPGYFTTEEEILLVTEALGEICRSEG